MKLYIVPNKNSLCVIKETTSQSILSDLATYGVFIVLFGCGIAFELLVGRSVLIEIAIVLLVFIYLFGAFKKTKKVNVTKEELKKIIDEL